MKDLELNKIRGESLNAIVAGNVAAVTKLLANDGEIDDLLHGHGKKKRRQ